MQQLKHTRSIQLDSFFNSRIHFGSDVVNNLMAAYDIPDVINSLDDPSFPERHAPNGRARISGFMSLLADIPM